MTLPLLTLNVEKKTSDSVWIQKPFSALAGVIQNVLYEFSAGVRGTTSLYLNLINIKKENAQLHSNLNEIGSRLEVFTDLQKENDRLRALLDFKVSTKMQLLSAQVISRDLVTDHNRLTINKGTHHGVKSGQAVITLGGVLGYIYKPEAFVSQVMLITDRYSVVDGLVQRTRSHGIVEGKSDTKCLLKYVERSEDVKIGDLVVTGGLDNIFPKGYPIATIESVERKTFSVSLKVELKPIIDANKVEEVFIVTNAQDEDLSDRFINTANAETTPATDNKEDSKAEVKQ